MSRQVDLKALVSHIVRGDGGDKCRICMGDTTEGQVFLGDTVLLDGNRPVTLSELLETITGVEVPLDDDLPMGLCSICTVAAMETGNLITFFRDAVNGWNQTLQLLGGLPDPGDLPVQNKMLKIFLTQNELTVESYPSDTETIKLEEDTTYEVSKPSRKSRKYLKKGLYNCPVCEKPFQYLKGLSVHLLQSSDLKRACHKCAKVMGRDELIVHLREMHHDKVFPCKKCPAIFLSLEHRMRHSLKSHVPGRHSCGDCGVTFKSVQSLNAHTPIHGLKTCPNCDKTFRNQPCYIHHVKICCDLDSTREDTHRTKTKVTVEVKNIHSKRKVKVGMRGSADTVCFCDYCGKKFSGKKFVAAHIHIVHTKNTHRPCPYCGKLLAAAHMGAHIKRHETQTFTCEHCGTSLRSKLGYQQHLRLHTGELPYKCQECGERFSASSRRSEHMRKVHKTKDVVLRHACTFCPAKFNLPYKLRKHLATTHPTEADERPEFECNICFEKFGSCRGLVHHSRKHQPAKLIPSWNIAKVEVKIEDATVGGKSQNL